MRILALLVVVVAAGCGPTIDPLEAAVDAKVRESLRDPQSAIIEQDDPFPLFDGQVVCGTVNAKNALGGYAGPRTFSVAVLPSGELGDVDIAPDDRLSLMASAGCRFQREYGARPGNSGKKATPEQASALIEEYEAFSRQMAEKIVKMK